MLAPKPSEEEATATGEVAHTSTALDVPQSGLTEDPAQNTVGFSGSLEELRQRARADSEQWTVVRSIKAARQLKVQADSFAEPLRERLKVLRAKSEEGERIDEADRWLHENARLIKTVLREVGESVEELGRLPEVSGTLRIHAAAKAFFSATDFVYDEPAFLAYFRAAQEIAPWSLAELWALKPLMNFVLLERLSTLASSNAAGDIAVEPVRNIIVSLKRISEEQWQELVEAISATERILHGDPAGAYPGMDFESRDHYRQVVMRLAQHSNFTEQQVAEEAIDLARKAQAKPEPDKRMAERRGHVGYYLIDRGRAVLEKRIRYRASLGDVARRFLLNHPTATYLLSIELATIAVVVFILAGIGVSSPIWQAVLFLLLPASEAGIAIVNRLITWFLPPRVLPKLDFKNGIPSEYTTMVVVPTLLLNEEQVRDTVQQFEIRYLANRQPNLFFALLTDTPDSKQRFDEKDKLVGFCEDLVHDLNRKYNGDGPITFFLFHRHRVYYDSEGAWIGWERKRGKLLDLNNLLRGVSDNFPVKIHDAAVLPRVRYVITLDADTQLPKDTAHRLVGTLAHPLNRGVIDPATNTVVEGYGILQPRMGVSVHSASRSRMAAIFSGETGFDIYTRAVSELYQDLFGEGSFTGKGIYEVDTFEKVLAQRFPENALLSHDLIEGVHARCGLASDIELIDDYPTRFSAYSRRKHRWVRGDWQIMLWLLPRVKDYFGRLVPNPLSTVSRWKILDNLRRSLLDVSLFVLLLAGWFFLPGGALSWTIATLVVLILPAYFELVLIAPYVIRAENRWAAFQSAMEGFVTRQVSVLFTLAFLSQQALMMMDAVVRTIIRMAVTKKKLLEWETAAQAESAVGKRTPVERYLDWTPWLSGVILFLLLVARPGSVWSALPILVLWASLKPLIQWLDRPLPAKQAELSDEGTAFLRACALRTWRYFRHYSGPGENWLIPDNVQESPERVAHRLSPTNVGLLLNARIAAYDLGYMSLPEFVHDTDATFTSMLRLKRFRGHLLNWYSTQTLRPLRPYFVSTVDSGNLAASVWTLKQALLELQRRPPLETLWRGVVDHARMVQETAHLERVRDLAIVHEICHDAELLEAGPGKWWAGLDKVKQGAERFQKQLVAECGRSPETCYWADELTSHVERLEKAARTLTPWAMPETRAVLRKAGFDPPTNNKEVALEDIPAFAKGIEQRLLQSVAEAGDAASADLLHSLGECRKTAEKLIENMNRLATEAEAFVAEMDFRFLYNPERKLLAVGYDAETGQMHRSWYDLLASEARTAAFIAIAKGDVPQESWFHLGRAHVLWRGERVLLSWTGTMFEYLMPFLWMYPYRDTILERSGSAAVRVQRDGDFVAVACAGTPAASSGTLPWGISEAACAERNAEGDYMYRPFGVPPLSLRPKGAEDSDVVVVAPYATFLALTVDLEAALPNLRGMEARGWIGKFGFYESVQFGETGSGFEVVRSWMVHHQGMSLLAICNAVTGGQIQKYFHAEPAVLATELLLHEKAPATLEAEPAQ